VSAVRIRPFALSDWPATAALLREDHWPVRSMPGWRWAFEDNPARHADSPLGWVLTADERVVGCLFNVPQRYRLNGQSVPAATCTHFVVAPAWRGQAASLMRAFFLQPGMDLWFSASANAFGAPFYRLFKAQPGPDPAAQRSLTWVASHAALAGHGLQRLGAAKAQGLRRAVGAALAAVHRSTPTARLPAAGWGAKAGLTCSVVAPDAIDSRFDRFWERLQQQPGLHLDRSAPVLRWRMADPDNAGQLGLLAVHRQADTEPLALAQVLAWRPAGASSRALVLDWCVPPGTNPAASAVLLRGLGEWAAERHLAWVEARRVTGLSGQQLAALAPRVKAAEPDTHWSRARTPALQQALAAPLLWSGVKADSDDWINHVPDASAPRQP
jgi:hypothetical protein